MVLKGETFCGKECNHCTLNENGKCCGCKMGNDKKKIGIPDNVAKLENTRYSKFCNIALCCKRKEYDSCMQCNSSFSCPDYNNRFIMNAIIEAKMNMWGIADKELSDSVPYQVMITICFLLEIISGIAPAAQWGMIVQIGLPIIVAVLSACAYNKMTSYSIFFSPVMYLAIVCQLFKIANMYVYGNIFFAPIKIIVFVILVGFTVIKYKITYDAFSDMICKVSCSLEKNWTNLWKFTVCTYIISVLASFIFVKGLNASIEVSLIIPPLIINCVASVLMIATIQSCKK